MAGWIPIHSRSRRQSIWIENAIGVVGLPGCWAQLPHQRPRSPHPDMGVEEPSIIAAASHAARLIRESGGFVAEADPPVMIGQIPAFKVPDIDVTSAE